MLKNYDTYINFSSYSLNPIIYKFVFRVKFVSNSFCNTKKTLLKINCVPLPLKPLLNNDILNRFYFEGFI